MYMYMILLDKVTLSHGTENGTERGQSVDRAWTELFFAIFCRVLSREIASSTQKYHCQMLDNPEKKVYADKHQHKSRRFLRL